MKKVSIIVPVYNVENYLRKCLDSLVAQTLGNIEILVVNDGSKDKSQEIIEEYEAKFPDKIRGFQKENGGLSDARNFGIERAVGEFIGFVDSDDYVTPTMFEEMVTLAEKFGAEMAICNLQKVDETGKVTQKLTQIPNAPQKIELKKHFEVFAELGYFACNKLFKRELFDNQRFKKGVHFEDIQLVPQLLLACKTLVHTQNYHYQYFERSDSITKTHTMRGLDIFLAVEDVEKTFVSSPYAREKKTFKNFLIFQAVYSFLAYLAFVKDEEVYKKLDRKLSAFMKEKQISVADVLRYQRFGKNYLQGLPVKKKVYYFLYFSRLEGLRRKLMP